jgi:hypothetical protein
LIEVVIPVTRGKAHDQRYRLTTGKDKAMSVHASVNRVVSGTFDVSTLKWISVRLVLPIVICGTIAVGLQTTIAGGPRLAAADLPQLASLTPESSADEAGPVAPPRQSAAPAGPGDARHQAAATMLLLLVATARKRGGGEAQNQAAGAERPISRQTADAGSLR